MKRLLVFGWFLSLLISGCDCGTKSLEPLMPAVAVSVSPSTASVDLGNTLQFTAAVTNTTNLAVDWAVSGMGCSGSACGTISATGLYHAPDTLPAGNTVSVKATSQADRTASDAATVTITRPATVSVSPASPSVDIGGTQQFTATVTGLVNTQVSWSVSGPGCDPNSCGTINAAGTYSAPDDPPSPATVIVTATSQADPTRSGFATVSITTTTNLGFSGQYAFLFNGFEGAGAAVAIAGSVTTDGHGVVTGGVVDTNRSGPPQNLQVTGGTYSFGADRRGRLNLTTSAGTLSFRFAMSAPNPPSHNGWLVSFQPSDPTHLTGSGVIKKQTPSAFSMTAFNGNFAIELSGELDMGIRVGAAGRFLMDPGGSGTISNGTIDLNRAGGIPQFAPVAGTYSISPATGGVNGRGIATLSYDPIGTLNFSFYVVAGTEGLFIGIDARSLTIPLLSGSALKQSGMPYLPNAITGPWVFHVTGLTSNGSDVTIGRFDANAAQQVSGALDQNAASTITSNASFIGQYSNIDPNGRGILTLQAGSTGTPYAFYMVSPNRAFLVQRDAPEVAVGLVEAQTGGPFTTASLSGSYVIGTETPAECGCTSVSGVVVCNGAAGTFVGSRDKSKADGVFPRDNWPGTFSVTPGATGRGSIAAATTPPENSVLYIISPNRVVAIDVDPDVRASVVTVVER